MKFSKRKPLNLAWILLPLVASLLLSATADLSFGRQCPPTQVPPMEGGGDEWPNTAVGPPSLNIHKIQQGGDADESVTMGHTLSAADNSGARSVSNHANRPLGAPSVWIWILIWIL